MDLPEKPELDGHIPEGIVSLGANCFGFHCGVIERFVQYAICRRALMDKRGRDRRDREDFAICHKAVAGNKCVAVEMKAQEQAEKRAIWFEDLTALRIRCEETTPSVEKAKEKGQFVPDWRLFVRRRDPGGDLHNSAHEKACDAEFLQGQVDREISVQRQATKKPAPAEGPEFSMPEPVAEKASEPKKAALGAGLGLAQTDYSAVIAKAQKQTPRQRSQKRAETRPESSAPQSRAKRTRAPASVPETPGSTPQNAPKMSLVERARMMKNKAS